MHNKIYLLGLFLILFSFYTAQAESADHNPPSGLWIKRFPRTYHVVYRMFSKKNTLVLKNAEGYTQRLLMPIPVTNEYHDILNLKYSAGQILTFPGTDEKYLAVESEEPIREVTVEYDAVLYEIWVDFTKIDKIYPYNTQTALYKMNTGNTDLRLNPEHPKIKAIAEKLLKTSADVLDYTRKAYQYQQGLLKWDPKGCDNLDEIFADGQANCGCLSSVLISLLRKAGIPSRYLTGGLIENDNSFGNHQWVEFYLENYGWIPADPSMFGGMENPSIGYESNGKLFFNRGGPFMDASGDRIGMMQTWAFYHWYSGGELSGDFELDREIKITVLKESDEEDFYQKPENINKIKTDLLNLINRERKKINLAELRLNPALANAAQVLVEVDKNKQDADAVELMKKLKYDPAYYLCRNTVFFSTQAYPENFVFKEIKNNALNKDLPEIGIGYLYDIKTRYHTYYILMAVSK